MITDCSYTPLGHALKHSQELIIFLNDQNDFRAAFPAVNQKRHEKDGARMGGDLCFKIKGLIWAEMVYHSFGVLFLVVLCSCALVFHWMTSQ